MWNVLTRMSLYRGIKTKIGHRIILKRKKYKNISKQIKK